MRTMWEVRKIKSEGEKRVRGKRKKVGNIVNGGREKVGEGNRERERWGRERRREGGGKRVVFLSSSIIGTTESAHSLLKIKKR